MVKQLEVSLYRSAPSFEAYSDTSTLKSRLQQLAMEIAKNTQQAKDGSVGGDNDGGRGGSSSSRGQSSRHSSSQEHGSDDAMNNFNVPSDGGAAGGDEISNQHGNPDDPEWKVRIRHKQQRLLLLHHSSKCPFDDGKCKTTPYCGEMKKLWKHMARCTDNDCRVAHCFSSKSILSHYRKCKDPQCLSCGPVRKTQESQRRKSQTQSGANDTMVGANGYGMPKSTSDNDMIENQNQFDVSTDANENNMVTESTANDEASPTAGSNESEMLNMSAIDTADEKNDDNESVSSTKSTYKDFCKQLTISLEIKNTRHREDKKEQKRLEQKVSELEREIERQKLEKVMYVRKVSTLEREIEQQKLVVAGLTDVAKPPI